MTIRAATGGGERRVTGRRQEGGPGGYPVEGRLPPVSRGGPPGDGKSHDTPPACRRRDLAVPPPAPGRRVRRVLPPGLVPPAVPQPAVPVVPPCIHPVGRNHPAICLRPGPRTPAKGDARRELLRSYRGTLPDPCLRQHRDERGEDYGRPHHRGQRHHRDRRRDLWRYHHRRRYHDTAEGGGEPLLPRARHHHRWKTREASLSRGQADATSGRRTFGSVRFGRPRTIGRQPSQNTRPGVPPGGLSARQDPGTTLPNRFAVIARTADTGLVSGFSRPPAI